MGFSRLYCNIFKCYRWNFKTVVVEPNTPVAKPDTDPVKEGYTFDAWLLGGISYPFSWPVTQNITLEPNFIINKYTVRF